MAATVTKPRGRTRTKLIEQTGGTIAEQAAPTMGVSMAGGEQAARRVVDGLAILGKLDPGDWDRFSDTHRGFLASCATGGEGVASKPGRASRSRRGAT